MSDGGKGSKQRPTDYNKFSDNFEKIFGKKPDRRLVDIVDQQLLEEDKPNQQDKKDGQT